MKKNCCIIFYEGYISISPTIQNIVCFLTDSGFEVDILCSNLLPSVPDDPVYKLMKIKRIGRTLPMFQYGLFKVLKKIKLNKLYSYKQYFEFLHFAKFVKYNLHKVDYSNLIVVDTFGFVSLVKSKYKLNPSVFYLSLELDFLKSYNYTNFDKIKNVELEHIHEIIHLIIQDETRKNLFYFENNILIDLKNIYYLPNGPRKNILSKSKESNYFQNLFHLDSSKFIVLSAGILNRASFSLEAAVAANNFSDHVVLVMHDREKRELSKSNYLQEISQLADNHTFLSLNPLPIDRIYEVFSSCHIGLVLYNPEYGYNVSNITFASGKLSHFLCFSKPIIVNDLPGMREFIDKYECGIVIEDTIYLPDAVETIINNYDRYSVNAYKCYLDIFEFDSNFISVFNQMHL